MTACGYSVTIGTGQNNRVETRCVVNRGDAQIQFCGPDLPAPAAVRSAELAWLMAHAPLAYVAKRWELASRGVKLTLMIVLMSAGAGVGLGKRTAHATS